MESEREKLLGPPEKLHTNMASRQRVPEGDSQKASGGVKGANGGSSRILG